MAKSLFFNPPAPQVQVCCGCTSPRRVHSWLKGRPVCARCAPILRLYERFRVENLLRKEVARG